jgi:catechol 2,3-dioxygenase-like lactoylglutathione lyase family enzyme
VRDGTRAEAEAGTAGVEVVGMTRSLQKGLTIVDGYDTMMPSTYLDGGHAVSRVQLALNVSDLQVAVAFYSRLFASQPVKRRPGYANFAVVDPPLTLVLFEGAAQGGTINHLGVEVESTEAVAAAQRRLAGQGLATTSEEQVRCCYALQDKVWLHDPDGAQWEVYTVLADVEQTPLCTCERGPTAS